MTAHLKMKRSQFALLMGTVNAVMVYLIPLIPNQAAQGFTAAVLNALLIYLATEEKKAPENGGETS